MAFDEDQRAEAIAAQWGVDVSLLEETDWEVEIIDGNDGEIYGYLVRFDDETDPDILTELGLRPGEFTRQLSINAFDEADYDRDDFESRHYTRRGRDNGYVEDRYVEDGYVGHDEPPVVPSSDSFAAFAGESFAEQAFAVRRASSAFVTADSGDITADNGVEPEVVTFRGEPVTHQGEPVTYTPRKADDGIYSMEEPLPDISEVTDDSEEFPDLPPGQTYLMDGNHRILAVERGRGLMVDAPEPSGAVGAAPLNEHVVNGSAYAGASFAGSSFARGPESPNQAGDIGALRREMLGRLDELEVVILRNASVAPNRGHNHPPELLEIERSVTQEQFQEVMAAIKELRRESESPTPDTANVAAQVSTFRRIARWLGLGALGVAAIIVEGVIQQETGGAYTAHKQQIVDSLIGAANAVMAWVQHLPSAF
ncbi:hypothetical protein J2Z31_002744 [Sinorhizobium kostiense]|uniref:Transmembrane protein n=1 Tax=Sinorhizobium kostiense TaxID=76747 RepID=A0ABS4R014_9HYPH|nr:MULTISPECIES: hypothetical protein [Sinorhizobium]MBP2236230.1 hypothetical protein [Sinorhizobium kostiense]